MVGLSIVLHFVWIPYYIDSEVKSSLSHEQEKSRLLSDTVVPAMLSGDLAEIHTTLDTVVEKNPVWKAVSLYKQDGTQLYPISPVSLDEQNELRLIQHSLTYEEQLLGEVKILADINTLVAPKVKKLQHLELLVLAGSFLIVIIGILLQNTFIHSPLKKLNIATSKIAEGDFKTPLPKTSDTVLAKFVDNFNHMRTNLENQDKQLRRQQNIQDAIHSMQSKFLTVQDTGAVYSDMLETLLELSDSEYGLIGEIKYDENKQPYLKVLVMANISWDIASRNMFEQATKGELIYTDIENLFAGVIVSGRTTIDNDPNPESFSMGLTVGHPIIKNFAGIPQYNGKQQLTGIVALANSTKDYSDHSLNELNIIWNAIGNLIDAHHRKELLSENEAHLRAIVDNAVDGIIVIDRNGTILTFNPAAEEIFGYCEDEILNESIKKLMPPMYALEFDIEQYINTARSKIIGKSQEVKGMRKNGEEFYLEVSIAEVKTGTIRHFTGIIRDISKRKEQEQELIQAKEILTENNDQLLGLSIRDGLTGLANRRYFDETLETEIKRAVRGKSSLSLILFDIDHFKLYNDHYGHVEGDHCLIEVANVLSEIFKRDGDLVARYGGEEFAVILPLTNENIAIKFAEVIREKLAEVGLPHAKSPTASHVTVSLGIASCKPNEKTTAKELITQADEALYKAKTNGRNQVFSNRTLRLTA